MAPIGNPLPLPWKRERLSGLDTRLPPSISRKAAQVKAYMSTPRNPKPDTVATSYHWRPVQLKEHAQADDMSFFVGNYVTTLTMDIARHTYEGAASHFMRLEPTHFTSKGSLWCYLIGGSFVVCSGTVVGRCLQRGVPTRISRLPANLRPRHELTFAALSREAYNVSGHVAYTSHLVTLVVTPDGWVNLLATRESEGAIDISAIRFCTQGGISLIDEVTLHTVDVGGTRMVSLQGTLTERFFTVHSFKPLGLLPESCRPPRDLSFVVSGNSAGGFHLLEAKPKFDRGCGGELMWRDSIWNHDQINLTGVMFEVSADVLHVSTLSSQWTGESLQVFVRDFQNFLIRKFGSIEKAWMVAFDTDGSGSVNFTEFGLGCKSSGYVGNATRLWAALDSDRSGEISLDELNMGLHETLALPFGATGSTMCSSTGFDKAEQSFSGVLPGVVYAGNKK
eukprot:TRINITY_DN61204_c0_g1_i1.p1 TRINITY_DN61204_c0_g1~~TRINITY_DN61204_c0_g1_i1.p1  ORF type:complete len:450 (+),score=62.45 TRINITY_DN61204_c0_g1_i1:39-1388(+)